MPVSLEDLAQWTTPNSLYDTYIVIRYTPLINDTVTMLGKVGGREREGEREGGREGERERDQKGRRVREQTYHSLVRELFRWTLRTVVRLRIWIFFLSL